ncbi:TPA: hypothetical protein RQM98_003861 [Aeromonas salmonicida]|nr:hypothetical protein [Aeromonas salmonicida]
MDGGGGKTRNRLSDGIVSSFGGDVGREGDLEVGGGGGKTRNRLSDGIVSSFGGDFS